MTDANENTELTQVMKTAPVDPRFSTTQDQSKHCWTLYNEYLRCSKQKGYSNTACQNLKRNAISMCPNEWIEMWETARDEKAWWGVDNLEKEDEEGGD